jgi:hypothetical protein
MTNKPPPAPSGLSLRSRALWSRILRDTELTPDSLETLERGLASFDLSDELLVLARTVGLDSAKARGLLSAQRDCLQSGLKLLKSVGLDRVDPAAQPRRGRPSRAALALRRQRLGLA